MTLNKRKQYEDIQAKIEVAESILERIAGLPGWYLDTLTDEEGNMVRNDEGMPVYDIRKDYDEFTSSRGLLALEANNLIYDTLMKWIDGKK